MNLLSPARGQLCENGEVSDAALNREDEPKEREAQAAES